MPLHTRLQFGRLVELTGSEPRTFNTDCNDLTTTVAAFEIPDMKEVGQSTSPLSSQEREVSSNPFCVSAFQQQAGASSSQQQVSSSMINSWQSGDLWGARKLVRGHESFSSVERPLSRGKKDRDLKSVQNLSERRNLHAYLERKAELAVQGECALREDYPRLRQKWTEEIGNKEMLILLSL